MILQQGDNVLSGTCLVAYLSDPSFDGNIKYSATNDGIMLNAKKLEIFAYGLRNPFSLTMHSNGNLYATDNGPNLGYGQMMTDCKGGSIVDTYEYDRLNLLVKGQYFGFPNKIRGQTDPRQCSWRSITEPSTNDYTAPLMTLLPSTDGRPAERVPLQGN